MKFEMIPQKAGTILDTVTAVLLIIWDLGYYRYVAGRGIPLLLVCAAIAVLLRIILENKIIK